MKQSLLLWGDKMKINLVFAPYVSPSCIPVGIASLKSYLQKNGENVDVKTIDLNIHYVKAIVEGKIEKLCNVCEIKHKMHSYPFQGYTSPKVLDLLKATKPFIKNSNLFYRKDLFIRTIRPLYLYLGTYSTCFSLILKHFLEGKLENENILISFINDYVEKTVKGNPELIGFSALTEQQTIFSLALAKIVNDQYGIPIVLGGPAFFNFDLKELMETFKFIDFIIVKEGEKALLELTRNLQRESNYGTVPNLVWRRNGRILFNELEVVNDLNVLPTPDFSDLKLKDYYFPEIILPISASRGCPWAACKFCQLNVQYGGRYRERSVENVIVDLETLNKKYNVKHFFFTDSELTAARLKEISIAISNADLQIYFGCYARPTESLNFEVLESAHRGGCRFLMLGVESLSDRYLRFVNKGTKYSSIVAVLKNANKFKIQLLCYMLFGIPSQTRKEFLEDLANISSLQKQFNIFSIIPCLFRLGKHQMFYRDRERYGIKIGKRREKFSTVTSRKVFMDSWLEYSYGEKGAYDFLGNSEYATSASYRIAVETLKELIRHFKINGDDELFLDTINGFLFETQLLYAVNRKDVRTWVRKVYNLFH